MTRYLPLDALTEGMKMRQPECEIELIPTPHGWGVYCRTHGFRKGPYTKKPDAEAAAEAHRASVRQG